VVPDPIKNGKTSLSRDQENLTKGRKRGRMREKGKEKKVPNPFYCRGGKPTESRA